MLRLPPSINFECIHVTSKFLSAFCQKVQLERIILQSVMDLEALYFPLPPSITPLFSHTPLLTLSPSFPPISSPPSSLSLPLPPFLLLSGNNLLWAFSLVWNSNSLNAFTERLQWCKCCVIVIIQRVHFPHSTVQYKKHCLKLDLGILIISMQAISFGLNKDN